MLDKAEYSAFESMLNSSIVSYRIWPCLTEQQRWLRPTCYCWATSMSVIYVIIRDLRSFVIRFDFESYVRFELRFVLMVRFEIFESSALSIVIRKETIVGG